MYRCVSDTLDGFYELTDKQEKLLEDAKKQIENAVPDLTERILRAEELYQAYEQTM